jgi:hypothetical protein
MSVQLFRYSLGRNCSRDYGAAVLSGGSRRRHVCRDGAVTPWLRKGTNARDAAALANTCGICKYGCACNALPNLGKLFTRSKGKQFSVFLEHAAAFTTCECLFNLYTHSQLLHGHAWAFPAHFLSTLPSVLKG